MILSNKTSSNKSSFSQYLLLFIIDKSRGEVSLLEQDTIGNVSYPINLFFKFFKIFFLTLFYATMFLKKV